MGQIQNSIEGVAGKWAMAATGAELLQPERATKAVKAQDEANTYVNTEVKDAYMKSLDADKKLAEAEGKADRVFDKYGVMPERARDYETITG